MSDLVQVTLTRAEWDMLLSGLRTLARLPVSERMTDDWPVGAVENHMIRAGHIREARKVLASLPVTSDHGDRG